MPRDGQVAPNCYDAEPIPPEAEPQTNPTWNEAFAYQDPRRIRLGVKFSW